MGIFNRLKLRGTLNLISIMTHLNCQRDEDGGALS